jgi:hypothetical protein
MSYRYFKEQSCPKVKAEWLEELDWTDMPRATSDLGLWGEPLILLRRLVFALAEYPERNRDEQDQYGNHEQIRYTLPHVASLFTGSFAKHSTLTSLRCRQAPPCFHKVPTTGF